MPASCLSLSRVACPSCETVKRQTLSPACAAASSDQHSTATRWFTHFVLVPPQAGQTLLSSVRHRHVRVQRKSALFVISHFVCLRFQRHVFPRGGRRLTSRPTFQSDTCRHRCQRQSKIKTNQKTWKKKETLIKKQNNSSNSKNHLKKIKHHFFKIYHNTKNTSFNRHSLDGVHKQTIIIIHTWEIKKIFDRRQWFAFKLTKKNQ